MNFDPNGITQRHTKVPSEGGDGEIAEGKPGLAEKDLQAPNTSMPESSTMPDASEMPQATVETLEREGSLEPASDSAQTRGVAVKEAAGSKPPASEAHAQNREKPKYRPWAASESGPIAYLGGV